KKSLERGKRNTHQRHTKAEREREREREGPKERERESVCARSLGPQHGVTHVRRERAKIQGMAHKSQRDWDYTHWPGSNIGPLATHVRCAVYCPSPSYRRVALIMPWALGQHFWLLTQQL